MSSSQVSLSIRKAIGQKRMLKKAHSNSYGAHASGSNSAKAKMRSSCHGGVEGLSDRALHSAITRHTDMRPTRSFSAIALTGMPLECIEMMRPD